MEAPNKELDNKSKSAPEEVKLNEESSSQDFNISKMPEEVITSKSSDNNSYTISTKLSSDQLICKSPQGSSNSCISVHTEKTGKEKSPTCEFMGDKCFILLGALQFVFGVLMVTFGFLVIEYNAKLAQLGGGIWAGSVVMATGISGVIAAAPAWCPLNKTPQKFAQTLFLALSLVSLAVSQLTLAISAIGTGRDINNSKVYGADSQASISEEEDEATLGKVLVHLPANYLSILANLGLVLVSLCECITAAIASYKSSRLLCPCFKKMDTCSESYTDHNKNALVSSWLGKHSPHPIYVVTAPSSSLGKSSKISTGALPIYAVPQQLLHPRSSRMVYPLIPAPLGTIPSPIIPPSPPRRRDLRNHRYRHYISNKYSSRAPTPCSRRSKSRSKSRERTITEDDLVRTYTGLDKTIAEEFIDICDSKQTSLCSDSSCTCCSNSSNNSDAASSKDYLVARK